MANKPKYQSQLAKDAIERLLPHLDAGDFPVRLRAEANRIGYSTRHLRRLTAAQRDRDTHGKAADDEWLLDAITAVFLTCGNIAAAHRRLQAEGVPVPSLRTFRRRMVREMGTLLLAYAKHGSAGARDKQVYLKGQHQHRMHTVQLDHTEMPIYVVPRGHKIAVKPWITAVMDASTRYILSWW